MAIWEGFRNWLVGLWNWVAVGNVLNLIAGMLLALNYFIPQDRIDFYNAVLKHWLLLLLTPVVVTFLISFLAHFCVGVLTTRLKIFERPDQSGKDIFSIKMKELGITLMGSTTLAYGIGLLVIRFDPPGGVLGVVGGACLVIGSFIQIVDSISKPARDDHK